MASANFWDNVVHLLGQAEVEIANLDDATNPLCGRLHDLQQQLESSTLTIGELAQRVDVVPRDVLEAALAIGVQNFWHDGQRFHSAAELDAYLRSASHIDAVGELEIELTGDQRKQLAGALEVETFDDAKQDSNTTNPGPGMSSIRFSGDMEQLLIDAAAEIAALDGTDNTVFRQLMTELQNQSRSDPASSSIAKPPRKFAPSESTAPSTEAQKKKQLGS